MRRSLPTPSRAARLVPLVAAAGLLAGCQVFSPIQTNVPFDPADGVPVDLGEVQIRDLVVVAEAKGGPGTLVGSVNNDGNEAAEITVTGEGGQPLTLRVPPHQHLSLSTTSRSTLQSVAKDPGGMVTLQIATTASGPNIVDVPVLLPNGYYEPFKPTPAPTSTATAAAG